MLKRIRNLLKGNRLFIALSITIVIAILSLVKVGKQPIHISHFDKIAHAVAYFTLTFVWLLATNKKAKAKNIVAFCCIFYGILIEGLQGTVTSYRTADYYDMIANTIGVLMALLIFNYFFSKKQAI